MRSRDVARDAHAAMPGAVAFFGSGFADERRDGPELVVDWRPHALDRRLATAQQAGAFLNGGPATHKEALVKPGAEEPEQGGEFRGRHVADILEAHRAGRFGCERS